jgi:hypothetical protein
VVSFTSNLLNPGERAGLDAVAKRKISCPCRKSNPGCPVCSLRERVDSLIYLTSVYSSLAGGMPTLARLCVVMIVSDTEMQVTYSLLTHKAAFLKKNKVTLIPLKKATSSITFVPLFQKSIE